MSKTSPALPLDAACSADITISDLCFFLAGLAEAPLLFLSSVSVFDFLDSFSRFRPPSTIAEDAHNIRNAQQIANKLSLSSCKLAYFC